MSNIPPAPETGFANYPRADAGAVQRLEAIVAGYFGINTAVMANLGMVVGLNILARVLPESSVGMVLPLLLVIPVVLFFISKPHVAKIGEGLGWSSGTVNGYCILIAVFFWFCFGVIGFATVQNKAMQGLKQFGFQGGGLFTGKKAIMAFVEEFKARAGAAVSPPPSMTL